MRQWFWTNWIREEWDKWWFKQLPYRDSVGHAVEGFGCWNFLKDWFGRHVRSLVSKTRGSSSWLDCQWVGTTIFLDVPRGCSDQEAIWDLSRSFFPFINSTVYFLLRLGVHGKRAVREAAWDGQLSPNWTASSGGPWVGSKGIGLSYLVNGLL